MNAHHLQLIGSDLWQVFGISAGEIIQFLWMIFVLYWLVSALQRKKTKQRESWGQRLLYVVPLVIALGYLFRPTSSYGWLSRRFVPDTAAIQIAAVSLTAAGVAISCWARYHLGTNWSGAVTLKEGHELIRTGPYRAIRHPIYTGILLALFGAALAIGEVRGLLGVAVAWLSFYIKASREESFLSKEFGPGFIEHHRQTGMFLPRFS
jgi:protein-S-isoprenylcysteine O-methyltransferase Ste14